jgi:CBS domain containing-hemolysin-like protein
VSWIALFVVAALHFALLATSSGTLEREFQVRGGAARGHSIVGRQRAIAAMVASDRAILQAAIFGLLLLEFCGIGESAAFTLGRVLLSLGIGVVLLYTASGVIAVALARYSGVGLIVRFAPLLAFWSRIGRPLSAFSGIVDEAICRLSGANLRQAEADEELLRSIEETQRKGGLDDIAAEMLGNVVEFADTDVSSVMTPRTEIEGIEFTDDLASIRAFFQDAGHSRIPVYAENLDDICGILYVKDLIRYLGEEASGFRLQPLLREVIRVPETKHVGDLLRDFQRAEIHMAIVIDEYGGTSGLITIEDVLEEIVGEIHDEHEPEDEEEAACRLLGPDTWLADGRFPLHDLEDHMEIQLPEETEPETVAGLVLEHFGRVPSASETFEAFGFRFSIVDATDTRVDRIRIDRLSASETSAEPTARSA